MNTATGSVELNPTCQPRHAMPAYAALAVALGSAGYMLSYLLDTTAFNLAFGAAFALALGSTYAANHGSDDARFTAQWLRFVSVPALLGITALTNGERYFVSYFSPDANELVAGWLGLFMVLCVISIGLKVEGRPIPIAMPLVAALSLFGLLNIIVIDTVVQICFAIFCASGLFLIGYERLLGVTLRRSLAGLGDESRGAWSPRDVSRLGVSGAVWFGLILAMALIIFSPLYALMPGILPSQISRLNQGNSQSDWRNQPRQMEVRGGTHNLSDREVFKVTMLSGISNGLWRGKVYQDYVASTWKDDIDFAPPLPREARKRGQWTLMPPTEQLPAPDAKYGQLAQFQARVTPLVFLGSPSVLIAPGRLLAVRANFKDVQVSARTGTALIPYSPLTFPNPDYDVVAMDIVANNAARQAPGLDGAKRREWLDDPRRAPCLKLPSEEMARGPLTVLAREIQSKARAAGQPLNTPVAKERAITAWLHATCAYSLNAPVSPSTADGVVWFLTKSNKGACDMFASSTVLLLRAMDVPARLASGYQADVVGAGVEVIVREKNAHAWVEYWVPSLGWISADPTAGAPLAEDNFWVRVQTWVAEFMQRSRAMIVVLPILGGLMLLGALFWPQITTAMGRTSVPKIAGDRQREEILLAYRQATRLLRRHAGTTRTRGIAPFTPRELDDVISLAALPDAARQEFAALTVLHQGAHYGSVPPETSTADLNASLERLKRALRQKKS